MYTSTMNIAQDAWELAYKELAAWQPEIRPLFEIAQSKAKQLADELNADQTIVETGAALMDLKLAQSLAEHRAAEHIALSVAAAEEFLKPYKLDEQTHTKLINCIEAHHGDVPFTSLEAEIVANADCYKMIHPRGFFAYLTILGKRLGNVDACLDQAELKLDEKHGIMTLDIVKQELDPYYRTLKQYIAEARKIATFRVLP